MPLSPWTLLAAAAFAAPPTAPPDFAGPQSAARPAPFAVEPFDQGRFDPRLKGYVTPAGFKLEIVADAPQVVNPVGMTFAPDGTLFVIEWAPDPGREWYEFKETVRYRDGTTRLIATMKKFASDPVKRLTLDPSTKTYRRADVLLTDELPSSILVHDGWLYLSGRGTVRRFKQSVPGGAWDVKETIAQGFCGFHHHQVSGLTIGNDGYLYITSGDDDNVVEGSDGTRATVMRTGAVFRCKPDGSDLEAYSIGYRNPYRDLAFDDKFRWFHADNDNEDGSRYTGCRLVHVDEGLDYGWRLQPGARCCRPDNDRGAIAGERPGKVAPMLKTGRGSPAGVLIYNDTRLPEHYRGLMLYPDVFRKVIRGYSLAPAGSTFAVTGELELLKSEDPLFRPCQMVTGPDGAIYICDWRTDSGGAGKLWGDGAHGRIYRLSWAGTATHPALPLRPADSWAAVRSQGEAGLIASLSAADQSDRLLARDELVRRGAASRPAVAAALAAGTVKGVGRLAAVGVLTQLWTAETRDLFLNLLDDADPNVRRLVADGLARHGPRADLAATDALAKRLGDEDPGVRRAAALALGRLGAADALLAAWRADDGKDAFITDAFFRGFELCGKPGIDALLAAAESGNAKDQDRAASAFAALRTRPAADALPRFLANPHLTPGQRGELIRSALNYQFDPPLSLAPVATYLAAATDLPADVRIAGLETLAAAKSLDSPAATAFILGLLDAPDAEVRVAAVAAVEAVKLKTAGPKLLLAAADAKKVPSERIGALKALRATGAKADAAPVLTLLAVKAPAGLRAEALRTAATLDPAPGRATAKTLLADADPAVVAEAVAVLGATKDGAILLAEKYLAKELAADLWPRVADGLRTFAADPAAAKLLADVTRGGLNVAASPAEIDKLRTAVLTQGNPKIGMDLYLRSAKLQCVACHRLEGIGGQVGPDLTRVWDTQTLDKLIESMVRPSKEIKEGYQAYRVETLAGQAFVGLKISETATEYLFRDATGRDVRLNRADVERVVPAKASLMPDDAVSQISYDQFVHLLAFLKSRTAQEGLRGTVWEYGVLLGFPADMAQSHAPETSPGSAKEWTTVAADREGYLNLKKILPASTPTVNYVQVYVHSPKAQAGTAVLLGDDPVRLWLNGKVGFERAVPKHAPLVTEETFALKLEAGWNRVLVKVLATGPSHKLSLTFKADGVRTAVQPDGK